MEGLDITVGRAGSPCYGNGSCRARHAHAGYFRDNPSCQFAIDAIDHENADGLFVIPSEVEESFYGSARTKDPSTTLRVTASIFVTMAMKLIDTHAHLESLPNLETTLEEARESGVTGIIAVGSDYDSNVRILEIAAKYPHFVFPALGLHPWELEKAGDSGIERNLRLIEDQREMIVAVGEVGLDYDKRVRAIAGKDRQQAVLREFLALAKKLGKPVSLHSRYSWKDCFDLVRGAGLSKVVFHWFTGFSSVLGDILNAGYYLSATPAAEYHAEHRRAVKEAPLSQLLLETDSPVFYGRENRYQSAPKDILRSLNAVAEIKGLDEQVAGTKTTENAIRLFELIQKQQ